MSIDREQSKFDHHDPMVDRGFEVSDDPELIVEHDV